MNGLWEEARPRAEFICSTSEHFLSIRVLPAALLASGDGHGIPLLFLQDDARTHACHGTKDEASSSSREMGPALLSARMAALERPGSIVHHLPLGACGCTHSSSEGNESRYSSFLGTDNARRGQATFSSFFQVFLADVNLLKLRFHTFELLLK